jgi:hypothetical protein
MQDRVDTLEKISGLEVRCRKEKAQNVFEFYSNNKCVKACFTYDKAKLFAEGICFGKEINVHS